jgi:hypothetical protein
MTSLEALNSASSFALAVLTYQLDVLDFGISSGTWNFRPRFLFQEEGGERPGVRVSGTETRRVFLIDQSRRKNQNGCHT